MDTSRMFACNVVHTKLIPGPITDPGNPIKVPLIIEIGAEELIIRASSPSANGKILGTEPFVSFELVTVEHINSIAQKKEIMHRSLLRMAVVGGITLVFMLIVRAYPLGTSILAGVIVAAIVGSINFLFNGGLEAKQDVTRFLFKPSRHDHTFYLEVPSTNQLGLRQALLAAGLTLVEPDISEGTKHRG
jgi:hypothetical protein